MTQVTMTQLLANLPDTIWQKIAQIDGLKGQWVGSTSLHPTVLNRLKKSVLVTSTGASTRIEGSKLSDEEIEKLLRGLDIQQMTNRDQQEVRGYYELLTNVFNSWADLHFSENLIKHFHQELLKYVEKDERHRGEYKKQENKVHMVDAAGQSLGILFDTTPAFLTPQAMLELVSTTQQALAGNLYHPLLSIGNFLVQFLQIHPFQDGNGRLSRILTNLLLLQAGYPYMPYVSHEKIIEDNKPDYYLALRTSQKTLNTPQASIVAWLEFFVEVMLQQSKLALAILNSEHVEPLLSATQMKVWEYLQQNSDASPLEMAAQLEVARPTINQVVNKLLKLQKIERLGQGRAVRYRVMR